MSIEQTNQDSTAPLLFFVDMHPTLHGNKKFAGHVSFSAPPHPRHNPYNVADVWSRSLSEQPVYLPNAILTRISLHCWIYFSQLI
ncbi:hypothetical protein VN97_g5920 [Penicillium thymicola]|uniref:Uncharacterized protein n=1 Tax=Penicillium thymicola TaxID=293382 RepID=A0AAI9THN8_PENTH|nr:hypothetical protein VN97_g5920 [Penicillium thymicola]